MCFKVEERVKEEDEVDTRRGKVIKFGWIEGVLMRWRQTIIKMDENGSIMFIGVFWTSGERCCSSGWPGSSASVAYGRSVKDILHQPINKYKSQSEPKLTNYNQGLLVITACNIITGLSALSMSAISTNGQIAAGGVYYMISRFLREYSTVNKCNAWLQGSWPSHWRIHWNHVHRE